MNAGFSFWQEFQAEQALTALNKMLPAKVYRNGTLQSILVRKIVPGDPIQLEEGDRIPADARLVSAQSLAVDISVLTGESLPVARSAQAVSSALIRPAEASNLVFAGATVSAGRGLAVVYATEITVTGVGYARAKTIKKSALLNWSINYPYPKF